MRASKKMRRECKKIKIKMDSYGIFDGWPGIYWLEQTADGEHWVTQQRFECNIVDGMQCRTHATIRALNWWNDLYFSLQKSLNEL
jgi:hypothetical protein